MTADPWGRTVLNTEQVMEFLYKGYSMNDLSVAKTEELQHFNDLCEKRALTEYTITFPEDIQIEPSKYHAERSSTWFLGEELEGLDIREFILTLCKDDIERERANTELDLYFEKGLEPVLRLMICLVDHFRQNKIIWGVGRGSSVASFVLYLIGVHKVNSLAYGLEITDFLRP